MFIIVSDLEEKYLKQNQELKDVLSVIGKINEELEVAKKAQNGQQTATDLISKCPDEIIEKIKNFKDAVSQYVIIVALYAEGLLQNMIFTYWLDEFCASKFDTRLTLEQENACERLITLLNVSFYINQ